jgi:hypothetical protein
MLTAKGNSASFRWLVVLCYKYSFNSLASFLHLEFMDLCLHSFILFLPIGTELYFIIRFFDYFCNR